MRKLGYFVVLVGLALPVWSAERTATISGYVRNAPGVHADRCNCGRAGDGLRTFRVFTDDQGFFQATGLPAGSYSVKVSAPAFLPTLREKVSVKAGAGILLNLTLTTLFDAVQFAPRQWEHRQRRLGLGIAIDRESPGAAAIA